MPEERIQSLLEQYPQVLHGFADISYSPYGAQYPTALVLAAPHGELLTPETYTQERFKSGIQTAKAVLDDLLAKLTALLQVLGMEYCIPPVALVEGEKAVPFSYKFAAVNAGLGWIGKNDVLVTKRYGPRIRLAVILLRGRFPCGQKTVKSSCPGTCRKCVDICPYHALHGTLWDIDTLRAAIIDHELCRRERSQPGRNRDCGLCMAACPYI